MRKDTTAGPSIARQGAMRPHRGGQRSSPFLASLLAATACLAQTGCTAVRSARVSVNSLPVLAESADLYPRGWHEVPTLDGQPRIPGKILRVHVVAMGPQGAEETIFEPPFHAQLWDPEQFGVNRMVVTDKAGSQSYSPEPIVDVRASVDYVDEFGTRRNRGIGFIVGGVGAAAVATYAFTHVPEKYQGGQGNVGLVPLYRPVVLIAGTITGVAALTLNGVGIYYLASDPERPNRPGYGPIALNLGPDSACVSVDF